MCTDDYHAYVMIAQEYMAFTTPHPLKKRSIELGNMPVVMVPLMIYSDDTSGNKSKMWNKFVSWCFLLAGLLKKENAKLEKIPFICTSNKVSVLELAVVLVQELKLLEDGIVAYDAAMQCVALIVSPVLCLLCDNPRAAQICSHLGSSTRKFCQICNVSIYFFTS